jgi:hypothetical protein
VATDQSIAGQLSNHFGVPAGSAIDQAGDFAFVGDRLGALFLRPSGATAVTRLLQTGDQLPGFPGSHIDTIGANVAMNSSAQIVFMANYTLPDGRKHVAVMFYDSVSASYRKIASSDDVAPGTVSQALPTGIPYGVSLNSISGGINDNGDIAFTSAPVTPTPSGAAINLNTLYIAPAGSMPLRIVGVGDLMPNSSTSGFTGFSVISGLNALGQVLITSGSGLFAASEANGGQVFKVAQSGDLFCGGGGTIVSLSLSSTSVALNNAGTYAFTEQATVSGATQTAICVGVPGGAPTKAFGNGTIVPTLGGTLGLQALASALALDDSGDILFTSPITGSLITTSALLRYHALGGQLDVVAYTGEAAPGQTSATFASFSANSIANNGNTAFTAGISTGGVSLYQQAGTSQPVLVAGNGQGTPLSGGGTFINPGSAPKQLNNGSVFFASQVLGGTAFYGQFMGTPGNLQALMSTADTLSGARVSLIGETIQVGNFVGFTAQEAGGLATQFVSNTATGVTTKVATEGDAAPGTGGVITSVGAVYYLNSNGQLVFSTPVATNGPGKTAIFLWSPATGLAKAVAVGDSSPIAGTTFTSFTLNSGPPSPFNNAGQLAFGGTFSGTSSGTGVFLYNPASGGRCLK